MPILTTPATAKPNLLQESLAITNERKPATTINLDAVNRGIGNRHVLKDKDQNLDDSNFRDKMDCFDFSFKTDTENEEFRHKGCNFEEFKPYLSVKGSLKHQISFWQNAINANEGILDNLKNMEQSILLLYATKSDI